MTQHSEAPNGGVPRNIDLAAGLRQLAEFLDAHPELPEARAVAWIPDWRFSAEAKGRARAELTALAAALGDRATETQTGSTVRIEGSFGPVAIHADADVHDLRSEPVPTPDYEPILPAVSDLEDEAWQELEARR